jgi:pimeloyl-ACP methyl ester carboxylesterase
MSLEAITMSNQLIKEFRFEKNGESKNLFVLFHAYMSSPDKLTHVKEACKNIEHYQNADFLIPNIPTGLFSLADPVELTCEILEKVDEVYKNNGGYKNIILVGHSLGALLARKLYVYACGENTGAPFEKLGIEQREWAGKVSRIILLAGMNRGWSISYHLSLSNAVIFTIGSFIDDCISLLSDSRLLIFNIRKGSSFITNLRLQWLVMRNQSYIGKKEMGAALTVQLLGSIDDMVGPEDNIDLVTGRDFFYLDAPQSGHANIIEMDDESTAGKGRKEAFLEALLKDPVAVKKIQPADQQFPEPNDAVTDVIFVMHGIRDLGYWTSKIARKVKSHPYSPKPGETNQNRVVVTETSSYGYFPMLSFLLPAKRREKVEWFMDQYTENKAMYPNAEFSFVGHSNGTYLLAKALSEYPGCIFKNVVFAGSVVPTTYTWNKFLSKKQVQNVMNYVATSDWVVAIFPKALELTKLQKDLGSAGHDGFNDIEKSKQIEYVRGAHSAALREENWNDIADFIINGNPPPKKIQGERSRLIVFLGKISPLIWLALTALILFIGASIINHSQWAEWFRTTVFIGYVWFLYQVLTRF